MDTEKKQLFSSKLHFTVANTGVFYQNESYDSVSRKPLDGFKNAPAKHCNLRLPFYCCCCDNTLVHAIFTELTCGGVWSLVQGIH